LICPSSESVRNRKEEFITQIISFFLIRRAGGSPACASNHDLHIAANHDDTSPKTSSKSTLCA
jgi:hypothetical protein